MPDPSGGKPTDALPFPCSPSPLVDGVLNKSWHGATAETIDRGDCCSVCKKACPLDQQLLRALVDLFVRIASDDELGQPKLVLSTTWRLYSRRQALLQR